MLLIAANLVPGQIFQFPQKESIIMPVTIATTLAVVMIVLDITDFTCLKINPDCSQSLSVSIGFLNWEASW